MPVAHMLGSRGCHGRAETGCMGGVGVAHVSGCRLLQSHQGNAFIENFIKEINKVIQMSFEHVGGNPT